MRPRPMLPFMRLAAVGMGAGAAVAITVVTVRGADEGRLGDVALGIAAGAVAGLVLAGALFAWVRRVPGGAEPLPADAEVDPDSRAGLLGAIAGLGIPLVAVSRGLNDPAGFAAALAGMPLGAAVGFAVCAWWLHGWELRHGRELLQWRRGRLRGARHYLRTSRAA